MAFALLGGSASVALFVLGTFGWLATRRLTTATAATLGLLMLPACCVAALWGDEWLMRLSSFGTIGVRPSRA